MSGKTWRHRIEALQQETYALYVAARDPRTPWYAKAVAVLVTAYAFSPIDLIPDPIPVLGYLDDLLLVPLGVMLALHLIPAAVMTDSREKARAAWADGEPVMRRGALLVVGLWLIGAALLAVLARHILRG